MRVLIVHESPEQCEALQDQLRAMQHDVQAIRSASGALMLLSAAEQRDRPYQLLLVNSKLQDQYGMEFIRRLAETWRFQLPLIYLADPEADPDSISVDWPDRHKVLSASFLHMELSAACAALEEPVPEPSAAGLSFACRWPQAKVLLVDDNEMGRQMVRALLENFGIDVVEAENGSIAVDQVRKKDFDLVLMDIRMPVMDGLSATRAIRALKQREAAQLPVIALTANALAKDQEESMAAGMSDYLVKPVELDTLYKALEGWLPAEKKVAAQREQLEESYEPVADKIELTRADTADGLNRVMGNRNLYLRLLKKFAAQFSDLRTQLYSDLEKGNEKQAAFRIHTLKGAAGGLGAKPLQQLAGQLERQLEHGESRSSLEPLLRELAMLELEIGRLPDPTDGGTVALKTAGSRAELQSLLGELLDPLTKLQVQRIRALMKQLKDREWEGSYPDKLNQLEKLVEQYRFDVAEKFVRTLLTEGVS